MQLLLKRQLRLWKQSDILMLCVLGFLVKAYTQNKIVQF